MEDKHPIDNALKYREIIAKLIYERLENFPAKTVGMFRPPLWIDLVLFTL